jgi:uncharacterized protein (UPF0332 family)
MEPSSPEPPHIHHIGAYWLEKAARIWRRTRSFHGRQLSNAVLDAYFTCFHVFSSVLLRSQKSFRTHQEVRSALYRDFIRTKQLEAQGGKHYDWLFESRQKADYRPLVHFDTEQVRDIREKSEAFVKAMKCRGATGC